MTTKQPYHVTMNNAQRRRFSLGPFEVTISPRFYSIYSKYTIYANGVAIRNQISYPEIEDGWLGLAQVVRSQLTPTENEQILEFTRTYHRDRKHVPD